MVIFDFDGTLANTHNLIVEHYNKFVSKHSWLRLRLIDDFAERESGTLSLAEARKHLKLPLYKLFIILPFIRFSMLNDYRPSMLFKGVGNVITSLHQQNILMAVLSSNNVHAIKMVLGDYAALFQCIFGNRLYRKKKVLKQLARRSKDSTPIYVTDCVFDIESAKKAKIHSIAVTWGLHNKEYLASAKPEFLVDTPEQLLSCIDSLLKQLPSEVVVP